MKLTVCLRLLGCKWQKPTQANLCKTRICPKDVGESGDQRIGSTATHTIAPSLPGALSVLPRLQDPIPANLRWYDIPIPNLSKNLIIAVWVMCPLPVQSSVMVRLGQSMQTWPQELAHMDGGGVQVCQRKRGLWILESTPQPHRVVVKLNEIPWKVACVQPGHGRSAATPGPGHNWCLTLRNYW